jgi:BirA family transcriptional regulator, biotin operon repressor / biotin---[acetyl-CoA-carboxylase] ligase
MNRDATDLAGVRHMNYQSLGSTNAEALALVRAGECGPLWISAANQSDGRGRRGSSWISPPGNLYATLLLNEPSLPAVAPQLSFVAGLAVHDAVSTKAPELVTALALKWPNDLLLDGKKLGGLLIEAESRPAFAVAIGIGINCASHPADTTFAATDLQAKGVTLNPQLLLAALASAMNKRLDQWQAGAGFASIRADWVNRAAGLGAPIKVRLPERQLAGLFKGIDDRGQLLLETDNDAVEMIAAGEVFALGATCPGER